MGNVKRAVRDCGGALEYLVRETVSRLAPAGASPFTCAWDFLTRCVWTIDEASQRIRKFPDLSVVWDGEPRFLYLKYLTERRPLYRMRLYEKSRRMMITWWLVALYLYEIMTVPNTLNAVASDKLSKSAYLLGPDRMQFIYDHIPPVRDDVAQRLVARGVELGPFLEPVWPDRPVVEFRGKIGAGWEIAECRQLGSRCMAMASGAAQMQQYTFSNVLMDEFPRWQWQEESWRNIQPTTQGGGGVDIVCTAELGTFAYDLAYDRVPAVDRD